MDAALEFEKQFTERNFKVIEMHLIAFALKGFIFQLRKPLRNCKH